MGIHGLSSNRKKTRKQVKRCKLHRLKKAERKRKAGPQVLDVPDVQFLSRDQLKHKLKSRRCAISVSGKRRNRMLKRLGHIERERMAKEIENDSKMEVANVPKASSSKKSAKSSTDSCPSSSSVALDSDVQMAE